MLMKPPADFLTRLYLGQVDPILDEDGALPEDLVAPLTPPVPTNIPVNEDSARVIAGVSSAAPAPRPVIPTAGPYVPPPAPPKPPEKPDLHDARSSSNMNRLIAGLIRGGGIAAGASGAKIAESHYDALDQAAGIPERRAMQDAQLDQAAYNDQLGQFKISEAARHEQEANDPASRNNRAYQDLILGAFPGLASAVGEPALRQMTEKQINQYLGLQSKLQQKNASTEMTPYQQEMIKLGKARLAQDMNKFGQNMTYKETVQAFKEALENNKAVERLGKDLSGTQKVAEHMADIESLLGAKLADIDTSGPGDKIRVKGKVVDLPGLDMSKVGLGNVTFMSGEARDLAGSIGRFLNAEIKDTSGTAVSAPEMDRIRIAYNQGRFNTERERIDALKRYYTLLVNEMKNREAKYNDKAKQTYENRGGVTSKNLSGPAAIPTVRQPEPVEDAPMVDPLIPDKVPVRDKRTGRVARVPRARAEAFSSDPNFEILP